MARMPCNGGTMHRRVVWGTDVARGAMSDTILADESSRPRRKIFYRHTAWVRAWHWINALCILFLLGSGLNIFNAHPRLYWGRYGADADPSFFSLNAIDTQAGPQGMTQIGPWHFNTSGVLGWSKVDGEFQARGWPDWLTIPSFQD